MATTEITVDIQLSKLQWGDLPTVQSYLRGEMTFGEQMEFLDRFVEPSPRTLPLPLVAPTRKAIIDAINEAFGLTPIPDADGTEKNSTTAPSTTSSQGTTRRGRRGKS